MTTTFESAPFRSVSPNITELERILYGSAQTQVQASDRLMAWQVVRREEVEERANLLVREGLPTAGVRGTTPVFTETLIKQMSNRRYLAFGPVDARIEDVMSTEARNQWNHVKLFHPEMLDDGFAFGMFEMSEERGRELLSKLEEGHQLGPRDYHPPLDLAPLKANLGKTMGQTVNVVDATMRSETTHQVLKAAGVVALALGTIAIYSSLFAVHVAAHALVYDPILFLSYCVRDQDEPPGSIELVHVEICRW